MMDDREYELKRRYDYFCHEFCEEINAHMRGRFGVLSEHRTPVLLGLLAEALHDLPLPTYTHYTRRLSELWEEAGGEEEFPTVEELRENEGDRKYKERKEERAWRY